MTTKRLPFARRLDPALLVLGLLTAFAAWPLITRPGLPTFMDGEQHVYRTFEIMAAWAQGVPYPRWAPTIFHGFGYPVFNYYAPLTYYLAGAYGWLCCGLSTGPAAGVKFVYVLALALGAAGVYAFGRGRWGAAAAVTAAAAYTLAPYVFYFNPVARGAAPETLALGLAPWAFVFFERLRPGGAPRDQASAALITATLLLAHNLLGPLFLGLLAAWLVWEAWVAPRLEPEAWSVDWRSVGLALGLGLGLAAFLWLPAFLERGAVRLQEATVGLLDFRRTFVPLAELLAPAATAELDLQPRVRLPFHLGLPQWSLALLAGLAAWRSRRGRGLIGFAALAGLGLIALVTPASQPLWEAVPPAAFIQFPWRLLGPAALMLGLLAGAALSAFEERRPRWGPAAAGLALAGLLAAAFPLLAPLPWADFGPVSEVRLLRSAQDWWPGTTATNEFLPAAVRAAPGPQPALIESYELGQVEKADRASLPDGAQLTVLAHGPEFDRFAVESPVDFQLRVFTFDFPGWTAAVDGAAVPITPSDPEGWITLPVPAGAHSVDVRFGNTWPRWLGWALSGLSLGAVLGLARRGRGPAAETPAPLSLRSAAAFALVIVAGLAARGWADQTSWWRMPPAATVSRPAPQYPQEATLEGNLTLLGFDVTPETVRPGEGVRVSLYWEARRPVTGNLRVFVHAFAPDGQLAAQSDHIRPGGFDSLPTGRWPLFRPLRDEHALVLPADAPAGAYQLRAGLWDRFTNIRMRVLDAAGAPTEQETVLLNFALPVQP